MSKEAKAILAILASYAATFGFSFGVWRITKNYITKTLKY